MSEPRTPELIIMAANEAESKGVHVNWKAICLELVSALTGEIYRMRTLENQAKREPEAVGSE